MALRRASEIADLIAQSGLVGLNAAADAPSSLTKTEEISVPFKLEATDAKTSASDDQVVLYQFRNSTRTKTKSRTPPRPTSARTTRQEGKRSAHVDALCEWDANYPQENWFHDKTGQKENRTPRKHPKAILDVVVNTQPPAQASFPGTVNGGYCATVEEKTNPDCHEDPHKLREGTTGRHNTHQTTKTGTCSEDISQLRKHVPQSQKRKVSNASSDTISSRVEEIEALQEKYAITQSKLAELRRRCADMEKTNKKREKEHQQTLQNKNKEISVLRESLESERHGRRVAEDFAKELESKAEKLRQMYKEEHRQTMRLSSERQEFILKQQHESATLRRDLQQGTAKHNLEAKRAKEMNAALTNDCEKLRLAVSHLEQREKENSATIEMLESEVSRLSQVQNSPNGSPSAQQELSEDFNAKSQDTEPEKTKTYDSSLMPEPQRVSEREQVDACYKAELQALQEKYSETVDAVEHVLEIAERRTARLLEKRHPISVDVATMDDTDFSRQCSSLSFKMDLTQANAKRITAEQDLKEAESLISSNESSILDLNAEKEQILVERDRLRSQLNSVRRSSHSHSEWLSNANRTKQAEAALKSTREEINRHKNALAAAKRDKDIKEKELENEGTRAGRLDIQVSNLSSELEKREIHCSKLRAQLRNALVVLKEHNLLEAGKLPDQGSFPKHELEVRSKEREIRRLREEKEAGEKEIDSLKKAANRQRQRLQDAERDANKSSQALETMGHEARQEADAKVALVEGALKAAEWEVEKQSKINHHLTLKLDALNRRLGVSQVNTEYLRARNQRDPVLGNAHAFSITLSNGQ
ncbi:hypothetical protein BSKO_06416 [Bryopsis sp. KO-2023]|nr:hypothetical protein BSKO_06416 [Bryopsis sp. KO-2023]